MAHDVFISSASENKAVADAVCARLEGRKIRCWLAPRDVSPGDEWIPAITSAIRTSRVLVVVYSGYCNGSDHVPREINLAIQHGAVVVPFRIEDEPLSDALAYLLSTTHWLDALTPPIERHTEQLGDLIEAILKGSRAARRAPSARGRPQRDWILEANLRQRFKRDGFSMQENLTYDGWPLRLVAERHKFGFQYEAFMFSELPQLTLDRLKTFTVSCGDLAAQRLQSGAVGEWISKKLTMTLFCAPVAVTEGLSASLISEVTAEVPYSFKVANSFASVFVMPAIYDVTSRDTFVTRKTPLYGRAYWSLLRRLIEQKLMP